MRRWTPAVLTMLLALAGPGMTSTSAQSGGQYTIQDLGFPGEPSTATGVNADGLAVGYSGSGTAAPFLQGTGLGPQPLPIAGIGAFASAINATGQVALAGQAPPHAYRYDPGASSLVDLTPDAFMAQASGIDNAGRVVGYLVDDLSTAVRWTVDGTGISQEVIGPAGVASAAWGTSPNGQFVVGFAGFDAFRWSASGLQTLSGPGVRAVATAVNNAGDAVGFAVGSVGLLWLASSADPIELTGFEQALAINTHRHVVGYGRGADGSEHALLYRDNSVVDLNTLIDPASGWVLRKATGINDAGQIVGEGDLDGVRRGFLLTPAVASDTEPPVISEVRTTPDSIWPPNHKMVPVTVQVFATDNSGETPVCAVTRVTSSDPDNAAGAGNTEIDAVIDGPLSVQVRAERSGPTGARVYTITVTCHDSAGNSSTGYGHVQVGDLSGTEQRKGKR